MIPVNNAQDMMEFLGYFKATDGNYYRKQYEGRAPELERWGVKDIQLQHSMMEDQDTPAFSRSFDGVQRILAPVRLEIDGVIGSMFLTQHAGIHTMYVNGSDDQYTVIDLKYKDNYPYPILNGLFVGTWEDALTSFLSDSPRTLQARYADFMVTRTEPDLKRRSELLTQHSKQEITNARKQALLREVRVRAEHDLVFNNLHSTRESKAAIAIQNHPSYDDDMDDADFPLSYSLTNNDVTVATANRNFKQVMSIARQRMKRLSIEELNKSEFVIWRTVNNDTERYAVYDKQADLWNLV